LLLLMLTFSTTFLCAQSREYQIKAAFLFNFTQFVEFPASSFFNAQTPFVIGILGKNPFGVYLEETVTGETVNGHPIIVKYYNDIEEVKVCHILFVNYADVNKLQEVTTKLKGQNILTVSDAAYFLTSGGMVRFYTKNNKIQLQVYLEAVKTSDLTISSKLLRLAEIFTPTK
jgi:hypothetical protein